MNRRRDRCWIWTGRASASTAWTSPPPAPSPPPPLLARAAAGLCGCGCDWMLFGSQIRLRPLFEYNGFRAETWLQTLNFSFMYILACLLS